MCSPSPRVFLSSHSLFFFFSAPSEISGKHIYTPDSPGSHFSYTETQASFSEDKDSHRDYYFF